MGAGCYKERTFAVQKEVILKAIQDQYLNDTILTSSINSGVAPPKQNRSAQAASARK